MDVDAKLTIERIDECDFKPRGQLERGKMWQSALWIRLDIDAGDAAQSKMIAQLKPHFLNNIQLYQRRGAEWVVEDAGNSLPYTQPRAILGGYSFILEPQDSLKKTTYYFRVRTPMIGYVHFSVLPWSNQNAMAMNQQIGMGMQFGALTLIFLFALISYAVNPNQVMGRFTILMLNILLFKLFGSGLVAKYVLYAAPKLNDLMVNWFLFLRFACWVWVSEALLQPHKTPLWYKPTCRFLYGVIACCLLLVYFDMTGQALTIASVVFVLFPFVQMFAILRTVGLQRELKLILLFGFGLSGGFVLFLVMSVLFPIIGATPQLYFARSVDFINPIVLLVIGLFKNRLKNKELDELKIHLMQMQMNYEFEKKLQSERKLLIDMLTHELKNPLASISLAINSLKKYFPESQFKELRRLHNIDQSVQSMDLIVDRCALMNQVDQNEIAHDIKSVNLSDEIETIIDNRLDRSRFQLDLQPNLSIEADDYFLKIILSNLVENAIKYSPADSEIKITTYQSMADGKNMARVTIRNLIGSQGAPDPGLVFTRFYRSPLAHGVAGSGLGLHLVSELCKIIHFKVMCESTSETVTFTLLTPLSSK